MHLSYIFVAFAAFKAKYEVFVMETDLLWRTFIEAAVMTVLGRAWHNGDAICLPSDLSIFFFGYRSVFYHQLFVPELYLKLLWSTSLYTRYKRLAIIAEEMEALK